MVNLNEPLVYFSIRRVLVDAGSVLDRIGMLAAELEREISTDKDAAAQFQSRLGELIAETRCLFSPEQFAALPESCPELDAFAEAVDEVLHELRARHDELDCIVKESLPSGAGRVFQETAQKLRQAHCSLGRAVARILERVRRELRSSGDAERSSTGTREAVPEPVDEIKRRLAPGRPSHTTEEVLERLHGYERGEGLSEWLASQLSEMTTPSTS